MNQPRKSILRQHWHLGRKKSLIYLRTVVPSDGHTLVFRSVTSQESVKATYHRLSLGERTNCASSVTGWVAKVAPPSKASRKSKSAAGPSQPTRSMSQSRRNAVSPETATLQSESNSPLAPSDGAVKWYDLRPNRCKSFHESQPGYVIDRHRFPHFFNSYKDWLQLKGNPDEDYAPLPRPPTPDLSDRRPSVISSLPSVASSPEDFSSEEHSITL